MRRWSNGMTMAFHALKFLEEFPRSSGEESHLSGFEYPGGRPQIPQDLGVPADAFITFINKTSFFLKNAQYNYSDVE